MASNRELLTFFLDQFASPDVTFRPMMGEFLLYYRGRLIGGVYDDRLMFKPLPELCALLPDAPRQSPYPGAKPMLLAEDVDRREFFRSVLSALDR